MIAPGGRAAFIAGLRELADFLEEHPDAPVPPYGTTLYVSTHGTDEEDVRVVDAAAAVFDTQATWNGTGTHYDASRSFGPVRYTVGAITSARMAAYDAENSYSGCVQPDAPAAAA